MLPKTPAKGADRVMISGARNHVALLICPVYAIYLSAVSCSSGSSSAPGPYAYYIDASNGNDANAGTMASPWQTLNRISDAIFLPDTTIYLKRGETWYEELDLPASSLSIDAYGSGSPPVIDGSMAIDSAAWISLGNNIYNQSLTLAAGEALGNVTENGVMLNFAPWNNDVSTSLMTAGDGSYTYAYPNTIYIKVATDPALNQYRASSKLFGIYATNASNISVRNLQVQRFSLNGIGLANCDHCTVDTVTVKQGGGATIAAGPLYAGNGLECDNSCSNIVIDNVSVSEIFDSGISPQTFASDQSASAITISNSTVDRAGFAGVEISVLSNGGTTGSSISDVSVAGLAITNSGMGWSGRRYGSEGHGIRIIADSGAGSMANVQLQRNIISASAGDGIRLGGDIGTIAIDHSSISANNIGINVADANATTLKLRLTASLIYANNSYGLNFNLPLGAGFNIYQNTFSDNTTINLAVFNQAGEARLQNNIFFSSTPMTHLYVDTSLANAVVDNNCYSSSTGMIGYNAVAYDSLTAFTADTGQESGGVDGTQVNLTSPGAGIFSLQSGSQCRMLGAIGTGVSIDYAGFNFAVPPSMGAYEFQ